MENQHRKISGYRELSQEEIDLMNQIKAFGPGLEQLVKDILAYNTKSYKDTNHATELTGEEYTALTDKYSESTDWILEGKVSLQKGLMFLTRGVAKPTLF